MDDKLKDADKKIEKAKKDTKLSGETAKKIDKLKKD